MIRVVRRLSLSATGDFTDSKLPRLRDDTDSPTTLGERRADGNQLVAPPRLIFGAGRSDEPMRN